MITTEEIAHALDAADVSGRCVALEGPRREVVAAGLPERGRGHMSPCASWEEAFLARTVAVEGGHVEWTGPLNDHRTPVLRVGTVGETAYRYAFRVHHGRDAEGQVRPRCGYPRCVAGGHLEDRVLRDARVKAEERAEFVPPALATWHRGVDLVAVERVRSADYPLPELTDQEQRYAVVVITLDGLSAEVIADRLGVAERTVTRWRDEAGLSDGRA
ncbi:helix-turn-helix domain-containing protein [Streptomyces sp. NPDC055055]